MALVACAECGKEVSDKAAACVGCGAPLPKPRDPNLIECPFCSQSLSLQASVCPGCKAERGIIHHHLFGVLGKTGTVITGIVFPALLLVGIYQFNQDGFFQFSGIVLGLIAFYCGIRILSGPKWFRRKL